MVPIEVKLIPENRDNRRAYAKGSAYYQKFRKMDYLLIHDVGSDGYEQGYDPDWFHWYIAVHPGTENPSSSRKAWHYTVGLKKIIQHLRNDEVGLSSGQGLFANVLNGNSNTIAMEMVRSSTASIQRQIEDNCAWLCAKLIHEGQVGKPYPECLTQHWDWPNSKGYRKNCPAVLRGMPNGWKYFVENVGEHLATMRGVKPEPVQPKLYRVIVASNTGYAESKARLDELKTAFPIHPLSIVLNEVSGKLYFRVVVAEFDRRDHATALTDWARDKGIHTWTVTGWEDLPYEVTEPAPKPEPVPIPEPDPEEPGDDIIPGYPPEFDDDFGLMDILRKLFEILQKLFGKEG